MITEVNVELYYEGFPHMYVFKETAMLEYLGKQYLSYFHLHWEFGQ